MSPAGHVVRGGSAVSRELSRLFLSGRPCRCSEDNLSRGRGTSSSASTFVCCFFFSSRRRHTRSDRDWSSDVCSSDLLSLRVDAETQAAIEARIAKAGIQPPDTYVLEHGYCRSVYVTDPNGLILE